MSEDGTDPFFQYVPLAVPIPIFFEYSCYRCVFFPCKLLLIGHKTQKQLLSIVHFNSLQDGVVRERKMLASRKVAVDED